MDSPSTHLRGLCRISGDPPRRFGGNPVEDEIRRWLLCDCQAPGVGGAPQALGGPWDSGATVSGPMQVVSNPRLYLHKGTPSGPSRNFPKF